MIVLISKVVSVYNRKTCMRLTNIEWQILNKICLREKIKRKNLLELIEDSRSDKLGLTPAVRLFTLIYLYLTAYKTPQPQACLQEVLLMLK